MEGPWPLGPRAYRRAGGAECLCARDSEHRAAASHSHQALQVLLCSMRRRQLACAPARAYEAGLCESGEALWEHRSAAPGCAAGDAAPAPGWPAPKRRRARAAGDQHQSSGRPRSAPAGVPLQPLGSPRTRPAATAGERADLWPPDRCGVRQRAEQGSTAAEPWRKAPRLEGEDGRGAGRRGGRARSPLLPPPRELAEEHEAVRPACTLAPDHLSRHAMTACPVTLDAAVPGRQGFASHGWPPEAEAWPASRARQSSVSSTSAHPLLADPHDPICVRAPGRRAAQRARLARPRRCARSCAGAARSTPRRGAGARRRARPPRCAGRPPRAWPPGSATARRARRPASPRRARLARTQRQPACCGALRRPRQGAR